MQQNHDKSVETYPVAVHELEKAPALFVPPLAVRFTDDAVAVP